MKIGKFLGHYYRRPRTTQERRINGKRGKWNRAKRNSRNLPEAWDDIHIHQDKCWKSKRKTQYKDRINKTKYSYYIPEPVRGQGWNLNYDPWILETYLKRHNISHKIIEIKETKTVYNLYYNKWYSYSCLVGTHFIWWHDKDIGIEYIIG